MTANDGDTQMTTEDDRIHLPGFGLPINEMLPWEKDDEEWDRYPHAIADAVASVGVTVRERRMLEFINLISDVGLIPIYHIHYMSK